MAADTEYPQSDSNLPVVVDQSSDSKVIAFVREHPVATIAGAAVVGVIVSALLPRRATSRLASRAAQLVEVATVAGMALGRDALEKAGETSGDLRRRGGDFAGRASELGGAAYDRAQRAGGHAVERIEDLIVPAARAAGSAGERILDAAQKLRKRINS
jgi:hypothetical protein